MSADLFLPNLRLSKTLAVRHRLALGLMVASGFAGLGYQIVWTQQCALWLGHEAAAVLAVVAAFFGGLAVGALAFGPRIDRSTPPGALVRSVRRRDCPMERRAGAAAGARSATHCSLLTGVQPTPVWQWAMAFLGTFFVLLPATAAMGATLPAMERVMAQMRRDGTRIAALYACNTFGAVLGVLAAAFWLVPEFGLTRTAGVCAALNRVCACAATRLASARASPARRRRDRRPSTRALALLAGHRPAGHRL